MTYIEPCPDCNIGDCDNCGITTLDHEIDEIVPCPCRSAGHERRPACPTS